MCALVRFNWIGAPQSGRIWFATTRATVFCTVIAGGNRFDPFGKFVNYHKAITIPPLALGSGTMKSNWSNSQGPLGGSGLHTVLYGQGLPWLMVAHYDACVTPSFECLMPFVATRSSF